MFLILHYNDCLTRMCFFLNSLFQFFFSLRQTYWMLLRAGFTSHTSFPSLRLFQSVFVITYRAPDNPEFKEFQRKLHTKAQRDFGVHLEPSLVSHKVYQQDDYFFTTTMIYMIWISYSKIVCNYNCQMLNKERRYGHRKKGIENQCKLISKMGNNWLKKL